MPKPHNLALILAWFVFMVVFVCTVYEGRPVHAGLTTSEHAAQESCPR